MDASDKSLSGITLALDGPAALANASNRHVIEADATADSAQQMHEALTLNVKGQHMTVCVCDRLMT